MKTKFLDHNIRLLNCLTSTILILDISCFKMCIDPDQLACEKPADQDPHCFHSSCSYMLITGIQQLSKNSLILA